MLWGSTQLELSTDRTNSQGRGGTSPLIQGKEVARVLNMFVFLSGRQERRMYMTYVHGPGCVHPQYSLAMCSRASDLLSESPTKEPESTGVILIWLLMCSFFA